MKNKTKQKKEKQQQQQQQQQKHVKQHKSMKERCRCMKAWFQKQIKNQAKRVLL